jgi:integrase
VLRGVLKRAKRWHPMADDVRPLPMRSNVGRAPAPDEKLRLLTVSASKPEWQNARLAALLALNTTMRAAEIRGLRRQTLDLIERTITVRRNTTKTDAGERVIPLNRGAWAAFVQWRNRAKLLCGSESQPDWYVFPHAEGFTKADPTRPMSTWRTAWRNLTRAINCPACGQLQQPAGTCANAECKADIRGVRSPLHGLRFHDLRHHAITELAESQANDSIIREIAGHVSPKMLAHYSHVRMETKRKVLDALSGGGPTGGYDTNDDTNSTAQSATEPQVNDDWWSRWEALPLFTRNDLALGDASFCFGNAKHSVAVPGSIIRPDAAEGKCPSAYFEVLGLGIQTVSLCSLAIDEWRRRGDSVRAP